MPPSPDEAFDYEAAVQACARQQRDALQALYRQEGARLLGVARRIAGNTALAEDIVHDAFVNIWNNAGSFDASRGSARGWIYSITRNQALNTVRDYGRAYTLDEATVERLDAEAALQDWRQRGAFAHWSDEAHRLAACLDQLPAERRRCIVHAYVEGLTHTEIAQRVDTPLGTVKAWIARSLKSLRECLS
ncbi:sigma-70 family RNA polymerase sigma factor [Bordetella genomosp. 13]|uniref:sigma-70 family RNA polymerase sigma factor n=1 Tax=Bordetella genomosp. 13 TaxID=463040 RepID=UPI0011A5709E|nr:sigma-70 family RNA polymerase sigma factor [Bordetella genomosp. 13]